MKSTLLASQDLVVTLTRYAPWARIAEHRDARSRLSLVLRGGFLEDAPRTATTFGAGDVLLKSHTVRHADTFGDDGAWLLSVEFKEGKLCRLDEDCWRPRSDAAALRLGADLLEGALARDARTVDMVCADLVASADDRDRPGGAPAWLTHLREEIEAHGLSRIDVAARAREAGVHPAHASRMFRRCFGVSITDHARAHSVRRALALMSKPGAVLSDVALAAGFYDQSHMNRAFRRVSGHAPGAHQRLVARAISAAG